MQTAMKSILFTLLVAVIARTASADCSAPRDAAELPYSVKYTTTGDASSTTFIMTVCNTGCASPDSDVCQPLKSVSVGAVGAAGYPSATSDDCGPSFAADSLGALATDSPADPEHCEALYLTADKPSATLADVCPDGCPIRMVLDNGVIAATKVDASVTPSAVSPSPAATPTEPSTPSTPSAPSGPRPYGPTPYRRRSLQEVAGRVAGRAQYGRRL